MLLLSSLLLLLLLLVVVVVEVEVVDGLSLSPNLMDPIINHPSISKLGIEDRPRSKLQLRHMEYFQQQQHSTTTSTTKSSSSKHNYTKLLNELGLISCETGVVPRKELLETFAAAVYIHEKFSNDINRFADIAAGHGLLSWFLLVLSSSEEEDHDNDTAKNATNSTAICIDRRMPKSAEIIATKMLQKYPHLKSRWCYVEADLQSIETHPTTLLVSVHACGSLSDKIIEMAIDGDAPLALVPCCHTIKVKKGYQPHPIIKMDVTDVEVLVSKLLLMNDKNENHNNNVTTLGDVVDQIRHDTLLKAGYDVEECMIPELFTKRNRLILGEKKKKKKKSEISSSSPDTTMKQQQYTTTATTTTKQPSSSSSIVHNQMPNKIKIKLPLADDPKSRQQCELASGRKQSSARLIASIPRHFNPTYDVSIWLPENNNTTSLSSKLYIALQVLANDCCKCIQQQQKEFIKEEGKKNNNNNNNNNNKNSLLHDDDDDDDEEEEEEEKKLFCIISTINEPHIDKTTGKISQTYRFQYSNKSSLGEIITSKPIIPIDKKIAKAIHSEICSRLPNELGLIVR